MMERKLSTQELSFLKSMLAEREDGAKYISTLAACVVDEMDDGGMGGLRFHSSKPNRKLGIELASTQFQDDDGIDVLATINLDQYGDLFELDIWKTNFTAISR